MAIEDSEVTPTELPASSFPLTRRRFIAGSGALAATLLGGRLIDQAPLLRATYDAYTARDDYTPPDVLEKEDENWERMQKLYRRYFGKKEGDSWVDRASFNLFDFRNQFESFQETAKIYYEAEKRPGESFVDYVERYSDSAFELSQAVGLDFAVYMMFSERAAGVSNTTRLQEDIDISRKQLLATAAERFLGTEGKLVASVTAQKSSRSSLDRLRYKISKKTSDKLPIPVRQAARIDGPLTLGAFDLETINFAKATSDNPAAQELLTQSYPDVADHFTHLKANFDILQGHKVDAVNLIERLYPELQPLIADFLAEDNGDHLSAIGIEDDSIDDWHRTHSSIPYAHYMIENDLSLAAHKARLFYQGKFDKDAPEPEERGKILLRDELLNPKFLPYLREYSSLKGVIPTASLEQLEEIAVKLKDAEQMTIISERLADASIGPHEVDSRYQLLTTAAYLRSVQNAVESHDGKPVDMLDRDSFAYLIYRMSAMTDWPPHFIQTGRFNTLSATKADPWDTTSSLVLDNFEEVLRRSAQLGHPLTPDTDLEAFLFEMSAFDPDNPNPYALPLDVRDGLANDIWLRTLTPPMGSWTWAADNIRDYVKHGVVVPYLTRDQREQIESAGTKNQFIDETSLDRGTTLETAIRNLETYTSPGDTVEIVFQGKESYHIDRPITLPKDRHVILRGAYQGNRGGKITVGAGIDRVFITDKDSGTCNVWVADLEVEVERPNSQVPLTLVDYDGKGSGNLFVRGLRITEGAGGRPTNTCIRVANADAFYAEGCSYSGSKPLVLDGVRYALVLSADLKGIGQNAVAITHNYLPIPGAETIDNFAHLQINDSTLAGFSIGVSTNSPQVNILGGNLDVKNLANMTNVDKRPVIKLAGVTVESVPHYQGGFDLHLDGLSINANNKEETYAHLSQIAKYDQISVFTASGNDVLLPWGFSEEQARKYNNLDGPLFTIVPAEKPENRFFMPSTTK